MNVKRKGPVSSGKRAERPSASPPDENNVDSVKELNRQNWKDEILRVMAQLLSRVGTRPEWQQRLDLANLAVEISKTRPDQNPHACLREASELMISAADELEWIREGKQAHEEKQREEEFSRSVEEILNTPDHDGWDELVPWEKLCYEGKVKKPETLTFPDGVEFEAYSRANKLKDLVTAWLDGTGNLNGWMEVARSGRLKKIDLHALALFRLNRGVSNRVSEIVDDWGSQSAPEE